MSAVTVGQQIYTSLLVDLYLSCQSRSIGKRLAQSLSLPSQADRLTVWKTVASLPVTQSTCVTLNGQLLAIGGYKNGFFSDSPTPNVYMFHADKNKWELISKMNINRYAVFAAVLPGNQLIVVGGCTRVQWEGKTDSVEIATVV